MEQNQPNWVNEELLQSALSEDTKDLYDVQVKNDGVEPFFLVEPVVDEELLQSALLQGNINLNDVQVKNDGVESSMLVEPVVDEELLQSALLQGNINLNNGQVEDDGVEPFLLVEPVVDEELLQSDLLQGDMNLNDVQVKNDGVEPFLLVEPVVNEELLQSVVLVDKMNLDDVHVKNDNIEPVADEELLQLAVLVDKINLDDVNVKNDKVEPVVNEELTRSVIVEDNKNLHNIHTEHDKEEPTVESENDSSSILNSVEVELDNNTEESTTSKSMTMKGPLIDGHYFKNMLDSDKLDKNQFNFYRYIFPQIDDIFKRKFGPKVHLSKLDNILMMEDIIGSGYVICNRIKQLDYPHCKQAIETLAWFHAATIVLHSENPELVERNGSEPVYNDAFIGETKLSLTYRSQLTAVADMIKYCDGLESLSSAIHSHRDSLVQTIVDIFKQRRKFTVLNQGDFWTNNILFIYEDGNVADCKIMDFRLRRFGSPAIDLWHFVMTSPNSDVDLMKLFKIYIENLNKFLTELDCLITYTLEDLKKELKHFLPWALTVVVSYLPLILNDNSSYSENILDLDSVNVEEDLYLKPMLGSTYMRRLRHVCEHLISFGLVDYLINNKIEN
ncbi:uncharacterized protein LOC124360720 [Homalodisca vitripennis]|uniref:uncharacterized protein LOC124360720 n=1 Tax=Homalodisca vitripennis TaxID=197043 RepID=UPI001EEB551D|nr:uncharacterized protein LOC124360720 [Homalodisca vitripennis]